MRRWLRRILIGLAVLLLIVEVLYLAGANYCLNAEWTQALANRKPEKFTMRWGAGWTVWPGAVHLRDVEMRGRSAKIEWYAHMDSVAASYRILPFFDRTAHMRSVSARGVDYRQRKRTEPGEAPQADESGLPPLPEVSVPTGGSAQPSTGKKAPGEPWTIIADEIDARVEQLWFDRYRVTGRMSVETGMKLVVRGPMEFPGVRFTMTGGSLRAGEQEIMGGLQVDVETALPPIVPKGLKAIEVVRLLSGRFQVRSEAAGLFFLEPYFERAPWLHFKGRSPVEADLFLDHGVLQPGSTVESNLEDIYTVFLDRSLRGRGRMQAKVDEAAGGRKLDLEILLEEFTLAAAGTDEPYARGHGFKVAATTTSLDLSAPFSTLAVSVDLPEAVVDDLSWFNRYVPAGAGLSIRSGSGRIGYHLEGSQEERSLHGRIVLSADDVVAQLDNYEGRGDLKIETILKDVQVKEGRYDISGTKIDLHSDKFPWEAAITLPRAEMRFSEPMNIEADIVMSMTDTVPLVAMFDAQKDISHFVEKLMTIRDIEAAGSFRVHDGGAEIEGLHVDGEKLQVLADLAMVDGGKDGILYIKFHAFSVGVEFKDGKKNLDLIRAKKRFEKRRAERQAAK